MATNPQQAQADLLNRANAQFGQGNAHFAGGRFADALTSYDSVLALVPNAPEILNNRGNTLCALRRPAEALASFDAALKRVPGDPVTCNNRGNALLDMNRADEALKSFDQALARAPDYTQALVNRGNALQCLGRNSEALASFERAITLDPQLADAHWNKGLLLLSLGDFDNGWHGYEWRLKRAATPARDFQQPQWRGENIQGKTILLHAEQGFGDSIQFLRYVPMVAMRGAKIVLELPDALIPLLGPVNGVAAVVNRDQARPWVDLHCSLLSLPLAFGTTLATIPERPDFLRVPDDRASKWRARLPRNCARRIGLVWSGKPTHNNDHNRSIALSRLAPLRALSGVTFVSLQREFNEADRAELAQWPGLVRLEDELSDFADTAAVIAELDLVIAVDTAVAHLAASLGKPVWILLPQVLDWRWMLDREDSPWYRSARLFRQTTLGNWDSVIARVALELAAAS
ncbi:MAG: tetratricopeptide repeat-containing glycosyltransferase family protein [Pseudolabrys sp.]